MIQPLGNLSPEFFDALAERYVVQHEVGRGSTATVYVAHDVRHDRQVAIKVLHPSIATAVSEKRFLREIAVAARLLHPNILPVLDSGNAAGLLYYVMPFVEGRTLRGDLKERGVLPVADSIRMAAEIAEALDYAHRHGVVHRDIKPGNILLVAGHPVISDFGIALLTREDDGTRLTESGALPLGTAAYMSPEQMVSGATVDGRSDIYSLGVVLREMLTGVRSVDVNSTEQPTLSDLRKRVAADPVPRSVERVTSRALALNPNARFNSALDMSRLLTSKNTFRLLWWR
jgi:eukaryotic-like serine/threonine-protein kinase